jgi:hypothetical protein
MCLLYNVEVSYRIISDDFQRLKSRLRFFIYFKLFYGSRFVLILLLLFFCGLSDFIYEKIQ